MASETLGEALDESLAPELDERVPAPRRRWTAVLAIAAVVLIGLNLRAGITSAAALFHGLQQLLGYGPLVASLLPTIPVLCFAVAGAATAWLSGRIGLERSIALALVLLTGGLALRGFESVELLLAGTVAAMSGLAICNVAMPSFIREHFAHRTSAATGTFTITMAFGATTAAAVSVPLAAQLGSPTLGLAAWALLGAVALAAFLPLAVRSRRRRLAGGKRHVSPWPLLATRMGLLATALFAIQALLVYALMSWLPFVMISRGLDPAAGGLILAVVQVVSIPAVVVLLAMATKPHLLRPAFMLTASASLAGYITLLVLPPQLGLIPAVLLGLGFGVFPLLMLVISRSGSSAAETTALSTLAQSVGYLFAAAGPFGLGLLHDAARSWTPPLVLMLAGSALQLLLCLWITAPQRKAQK
ncbi:MFS superfamily transporter [Arthrobacter crystallopoietes BAB-32]|uniref:MFS superfamily transporter n=1 Tax=Arthrobacter crystallopoietes BAB-32 TaxID=1246476 RepID=N1V1Q5_9MICC|nr:MFS transporter [Arthrobacter crystallopoietes]EMY33919.1 MFS superfamily transporter [Arthrobacter crystallopoietes BAB-32]